MKLVYTLMLGSLSLVSSYAQGAVTPDECSYTDILGQVPYNNLSEPKNWFAGETKAKLARWLHGCSNAGVGFGVVTTPDSGWMTPEILQVTKKPARILLKGMTFDKARLQRPIESPTISLAVPQEVERFLVEDSSAALSCFQHRAQTLVDHVYKISKGFNDLAGPSPENAGNFANWHLNIQQAYPACQLHKEAIAKQLSPEAAQRLLHDQLQTLVPFLAITIPELCDDQPYALVQRMVGLRDSYFKFPSIIMPYHYKEYQAFEKCLGGADAKLFFQQVTPAAVCNAIKSLDSAGKTVSFDSRNWLTTDLPFIYGTGIDAAVQILACACDRAKKQQDANSNKLDKNKNCSEKGSRILGTMYCDIGNFFQMWYPHVKTELALCAAKADQN
jgi:hypothetical protein